MDECLRKLACYIIKPWSCMPCTFYLSHWKTMNISNYINIRKEFGHVSPRLFVLHDVRRVFKHLANCRRVQILENEWLLLFGIVHKDFYLLRYMTFLNQVISTVWTICAFQVLNPIQWSLAKQLQYDAKIIPKQVEVKGDGV